MNILTHVFLGMSFLLCTGCMTGLVIDSAIKGAPKQDNVEFVNAFGNDDDLVVNLYGSLAEGEKAKYAMNLGNEWAADFGTDFFAVKRTKVTAGYSIQTADWTEIKIFKKSDYYSMPEYGGKGCHFIQECINGECKAKLYYECYDDSRSVVKLRKIFFLQPELSFPPLYKLILVPLTLPADIITSPLQLMLAIGLSHVN